MDQLNRAGATQFFLCCGTQFYTRTFRGLLFSRQVAPPKRWSRQVDVVPREGSRLQSFSASTTDTAFQTPNARRADLRAVLPQTSGRPIFPQSSALTTEKPPALQNAVRAPLRPPRPTQIGTTPCQALPTFPACAECRDAHTLHDQM